MSDQEEQLGSISSTRRVEMCPPSAFLPLKVNTTGASAERGTEIHTYLADVLDKGLSKNDALLKVSPEYHKTCHDIDLAKILPGMTGVRFEVAYAIDLETDLVRELGTYLDRAYPFTRPSEVRGSLDIEGFVGLTPGVKDIKTGQWVGPAKDNWQLRFFTAALMFKHDCKEALGSITYIQDDGKVEQESAMFSLADAYNTIEELKALRKKVSTLQALYTATGKAEVHPGEHCKYCPVFEVCPDKTALVKSMVDRVTEMDAKVLEALSPQELSQAWVMYENLRPIFLRVEKSLKDIGRFRGIALEDGRSVKSSVWEKRELNSKKLFALLRGAGIDEATLAGCTSTVKIPLAKVFPATKPVKSKKKK